MEKPAVKAKRSPGRSMRLRIGLAVFVAAIGLFAAGGIREQQQYEAQIASGSKAASAPASPIDISEKPRIAVTRTDVVTTEEEVPYTTTQTYDGTLPKDTTVVRVEGRNGKKIIKTEVKTRDGVEVSRALISEEITVPPVSKIVAIGTKVTGTQKRETKLECDVNYKPCIPLVRSDLDCDDLGFRVEIVGEDVHNLDEDDADGIGCERF